MRKDEAELIVKKVFEELADLIGIDAETAMEKDEILDTQGDRSVGLDSLYAISLAAELEDVFETTFQSEMFVGINQPSVISAVVVRDLQTKGLIDNR